MNYAVQVVFDRAGVGGGGLGPGCAVVMKDEGLGSASRGVAVEPYSPHIVGCSR
jgi:hypothetical protein